MSVKLIPPDLKQCQAEKPNGNSFMTLGGVPGLVRCKEKPTVVAYENNPAEDGLKGSMSLCDSCAKKLVETHGSEFATLKPIRRKQ